MSGVAGFDFSLARRKRIAGRTAAAASKAPALVKNILLVITGFSRPHLQCDVTVQRRIDTPSSAPADRLSRKSEDQGATRNIRAMSLTQVSSLVPPGPAYAYPSGRGWRPSMSNTFPSRRNFLKMVSAVTAAGFLRPGIAACDSLAITTPANKLAESGPPDYTLRIAATPIELARNHIVSAITYNGQFPGPLLRFKEGQRVIVDVHNDTDTPEQLHWHGQFVPVDVDGAAEEGTPFIPAHGMRRISFAPGPAGLRFYHSHLTPGADLSGGQYSGQVGTVYIEPKRDPGRYDREVFLMLKEFGPTLSRGGDMASDFLANPARIRSLEDLGEAAMRASMASGKPHGFEVGYSLFSINGRMLGHGEPVRVKQGERVLFHIVNGSATEIRSLALPGHRFEVVALDGNPVPKPTEVSVLWLGTAERVSAIVEMKNPGIWVMGDLADDDRSRGMGVVVEYAGRSGKPKWVKPAPSRWDYTLFGKQGAAASAPDETLEMTFEKKNAA